MKFGVQTFTIRKAQKKSIRAAYMPLIEMGIKSFEVARIDFNEKNAKELRSLVDEFGIEIVSIQVKPKYVFGDPERIISFCRITGCRRVVISMLPFSCILGKEKKFYDFVASLDVTFDVYSRQGITLAYHHHNWEYIKLSSGQTRMSEIIGRTKRIRFVHDTYWTARCGIYPAVQIAEFGERLIGVHLRDLTFTKKGLDVIGLDSAIGDGLIDFASVIRAAEKVGCRYYVIEQKTDDPYGEIGKSFKNLEAIRVAIREEE